MAEILQFLECFYQVLNIFQYNLKHSLMAQPTATTNLFLIDVASGQTHALSASLTWKPSELRCQLNSLFGGDPCLLNGPLILHQGRPLPNESISLQAIGVRCNQTLTLVPAPLYGGSRFSTLIKTNQVHATFSQTTDTPWKNSPKALKNKDKEHLSEETEAQLQEFDNYLQQLPDSCLNNYDVHQQNQIIKLLKSIKYHASAQIKEFLQLEGAERSIESLIGLLNIRCSFDIFVAMQPDNLCLSQIDGRTKGLSDDQCQLLQYIRSFTDKSICKFMALSLQNINQKDVTLADYELELHTNFVNSEKLVKIIKPQQKKADSDQQQLEILLKTHSDRLKLVLMLGSKPQGSGWKAEDFYKLYQWTLENDEKHRNQVFDLVTLCDEEILKQFKQLLKSNEKYGRLPSQSFQAWQGIYQATGRKYGKEYFQIKKDDKEEEKPDIRIDPGLRVEEYTQGQSCKTDVELEKFEISLQREVELPMKAIILDSLLRVKHNQIEKVRLEQCFNNCLKGFKIHGDKTQNLHIKEDYDLIKGYRLALIDKKKLLRDFKISQPLPLEISSQQQETKEYYLFAGMQGEVFWFSRLAQVDKLQKPNLCINILIDEVGPGSQETVKEVLINNESKLYQTLEKQVQCPNEVQIALPRLVTHQDKHFIVFSSHSQEQTSVQFYDIEEQIEVVSVLQAEAFVHKDNSGFIFMTQSGQFQTLEIDFSAIEKNQEISLPTLGVQSYSTQDSERTSVVQVISTAQDSEDQRFAIFDGLSLKAYQVQNSRVNQIFDSKRVWYAARGCCLVQNKDSEIDEVLMWGEEKFLSEQCTFFLYKLSKSESNNPVTRFKLKIEDEIEAFTLKTARKFDNHNYQFDFMSPDKREQWVDFSQAKRSWFQNSSKITQMTNFLCDIKDFESSMNRTDYLKGFRVIVDHPLVLFYHIQRPNCFIVQSLVESSQSRRELFQSLVESSQSRRVLFELQGASILAIDILQASLQTQNAAFVIIVQQDEKISRWVLKMSKPFEYGQLARLSSWSVTTKMYSLEQETSTGYQKALNSVQAGVNFINLSSHRMSKNLSELSKNLIQMKNHIEDNRLRDQFVFMEGKTYELATVYTTFKRSDKEPAMIYFVNFQDSKTAKQQNQSIYELIDSQAEELCPMTPIRSKFDSILFAKRSKIRQETHVVKLKVKFDQNKGRWIQKQQIVYTTTKDLRQIQFVRDVEAKTTDVLADDTNVQRRLQLISFDATELEVIQKKAGTKIYQRVEQIDLTKLEKFNEFCISLHKEQEQQSIQSMQSIVVSPRALTVCNQVFVRQSGEAFQIFTNDEQTQNKSATFIGTQIVPQSDQIMTFCQVKDDFGQVKKHSVMFENDPSRRNRSIVGARHLPYLLKVIPVSAHLLFLLVGTEKNQYWTMMTKNGRLVEMDFCMKQALSIDPKEQVQFSNELEQWHRHQVCHINGKICKLFLYKRQTSDSQPARARVLEISNRGELLRRKDHEFKLNKQSSSEIQDIFMNWRGQLVEVNIHKQSRRSCSPELKQTPVGSIAQVRVTFQSMQKKTQFVIAGKYLCWYQPKQDQDIQIRFIPVFKEKEPGEKHVTAIKLVDCFLSKESEKAVKQSRLCVYDVEPFLAAKADPTGMLDEKHLKKYGDRITLTIRDRVKILPLDKIHREGEKIRKKEEEEKKKEEEEKKKEGDEKKKANNNSKSKASVVIIAGELLSTESLMDPQKYVITEHRCGTISQLKEQDYFYNYFSVMQLQNFIVHKQSPLDQQKNQGKILGVYCTFAGIDYFEAMRLQHISAKFQKPESLDLDALFGSFGMDTMFTLLPAEYFSDDPSSNQFRAGSVPKALQYIYEKIQELDFSAMNDVEGLPRTNPDAFRLSTILLKNTVIVHKIEKEKDKESGEFKKSLKFMIRNCFFQQFEDNSTVKDVLLDIGNSLPGFAITQGLCNQSDFAILIKNCTASVLQTLDNCCQEDQATESIHLLNWPKESDVSMITYKSSKGVLSEGELNDYIKENYDRRRFCTFSCKCSDSDQDGLRESPVNVRVIHMDWFYRNNPEGSFIDFATIMVDQREEVYATEFVQAVLNQEWPSIKKYTIRWRMLPFIALLILQVWNMHEQISFTAVGQNYGSDAFGCFLNIICILLIIFNGFFEINQMIEKGKRCFNLWNMLDGIILVLSFVMDILVLLRFQLQEVQIMKTISAFVVFCFMTKLFEWMKIFDETAFYISLLYYTLVDIMHFMLVYGIAVLTVGLSTMFLIMETGGHEKRSPTSFYSDFIKNGLFLQYQVSLGEFGPLADTYLIEDSQLSDLNMILVHLLFILSTSMTMIVILNMLIAIMAETFAKVYEKKHLYNMMTKLDFVSDIEKHQKKVFKLDQGDFLYVITPFGRNDGDDGDAYRELSIQMHDQLNSINQKLTWLQSSIELRTERHLSEQLVQMAKDIKTMAVDIQQLKDKQVQEHMSEKE